MYRRRKKNTAGIDDDQLGIVAPASAPFGDLTEASVWETTQLARGIKGGLVVGDVTGLIGSLLAVTLPPAGLSRAGSAVVATSAASAGFVAVVAGLIAKGMPRKDIDALRGAIIAGHILILVDVPRKRRPDIIKVLKTVYPNTIIHSATATSPLEGPFTVVSR